MSDPHRLSDQALESINASERIGIAAISCWEMCMLVAKKRIELNCEVVLWMENALAEPRVNLLPLTPSIAAASTQLGDHMHADPADRLIVSTALAHHAELVTKDQAIRDADVIATIW